MTDHPVTVYNSAFPPTSPACQYPEDPSIGLNGTQTVFALDANHCLILTNLEFGQDPINVDRQAPRQNERYFGQTLTRTDTMIRTRMLTSEEGISVNALLKMRSRQYIAGYEEAWLFPERIGLVDWEEIGRILLPPTDKLGQFGGETFVEYRDGSTRFQDAYGRTELRYGFGKQKVPSAEPKPNDICGCGSGRKYKKCCYRVDIGDRPPWDVYSIRERNIAFYRAVVDILGLNKKKTWEDVRRELSSDQVKRIHEMLEWLWPQDTNIADLLPRPDSRIFRAVYWGHIDPRTISESVISSLAYFDEIVILNPFPNPLYMNPDISPTRSPALHKSQMLKNVSVLMALQPFINAGFIHLGPNPVEFNAGFQQAMMAMVKARPRMKPAKVWQRRLPFYWKIVGKRVSEEQPLDLFERELPFRETEKFTPTSSETQLSTQTRRPYTFFVVQFNYRGCRRDSSSF